MFKCTCFKLLGLLLFTSLLLGCRPNHKKCSRGYDLEHPLSVYPVKKSYHVGDTIWFEMNFSDVVKAEITNNINGKKSTDNILLQNFDFQRNFLVLFELSDTTVNTAGQIKNNFKEAFDPIYETGTILYELPLGPEYKLIYENNTYRLKVGMILKRKGVFVAFGEFMHYYNMACLGRLNEQDLTPGCEKEMITDIRFPINRQPDGTHKTNYHIFEQWMNLTLENNPEFIQRECFTFKVE
jgi:hypothetical protein